MMGANEINMRNFKKVQEELRAKYGTESKNELNDRNSGLSADTEWLGSNGKIWVTIVPITASTSLMTTGFKPAM